MKAHSCPRSQPILGLDLLEFFFDNAVDPGGSLAQVPELAESSHPRLAAAVVSPEFVSESLRDECPKRNPTFGGNGFGAAKDRVGNFERRLHACMFPYLWVTVNSLNNFWRQKRSDSQLGC